jgi:hypothetical protein
MGHRPFFMESKNETPEWATCDRCGLKIKEVQDGKTFWNPSPRARIRNLCQHCNDVRIQKNEESFGKRETVEETP